MQTTLHEYPRHRKMMQADCRPGLLRRWPRSQLMQVMCLIFILGVLMIGVNIYQLHVMHSSHLALHGLSSELDGGLTRSGPHKVWVAGKRLDSGYLNHIYAVFSRIGYVRNTGALDGHDWDVLWAHDYPFGKNLGQYLQHIKPYQRINHFPGSGFITNKVALATSSRISHIPKAWRIPYEKDEFLKYAKAHPDHMWVQKSNNHRGIKIKELVDLNLVSEETFVQEYIGNPYLIDGYRFDIGLYTVVTSINPLRVYVFNDEWLVRFCPELYYPFDPKVINKYVVTDDYKAPWDIGSMRKYYTDQDVTRREALMRVLEEEGRDGKKLERDLFDTIVSVFLDKENDLIKNTAKYPSTRNFFEMMRFDFVLDDELNVYLMEVNMSPNLSSGHFAANKQMYEQVVFGLLNLVGVARPAYNDIPRSNDDEANMVTSSKDIRVYTKICHSAECRENCAPTICKLCKACLKGDDEVTLKMAAREHVTRHGFQRILPQTFASQKNASDWDYSKDKSFLALNKANQWMTLWFRGKCILDGRWCH